MLLDLALLVYSLNLFEFHDTGCPQVEMLADRELRTFAFRIRGSNLFHSEESEYQESVCVTVYIDGRCCDHITTI